MGDFMHLQVRRLESALKEEEKSKPSTDADCTKKGRKRLRDDETGGSNGGSQKIKPTTEELKKMNVKELREQATLLGVSATGSKKELLQRLSSDDAGKNNTDDGLDKGSLIPRFFSVEKGE